jgi:hypothetical protein
MGQSGRGLNYGNVGLFLGLPFLLTACGGGNTAGGGGGTAQLFATAAKRCKDGLLDGQKD